MGCVERRSAGCAHDGVPQFADYELETRTAHWVPDADVGGKEPPAVGRWRTRGQRILPASRSDPSSPNKTSCHTRRPDNPPHAQHGP